MPNDVLLGVAAAAVLLIGVVAVVQYVRRAERQRESDFQKAALHLGWRLDGPPNGVPPAEVAAFRLFTQGRARRTTNLHRGRPGLFDAALFEYRYTTGGGKDSHTHRQTMIAFNLPRSTLPSFELRPEHVFHRIGAAFGYQDIDIENQPEFSRAYLLRGTDEAGIRRTFHSEITHHFERNQGWSVDASGSWVVIYRAGRRVKPDELGGFVRDCDQIASVLAQA